MKQQFTITNLLLLSVIVAFAVYWFLPPETFPFTNVTDAANASRNHNHLELRMILGDEEGPFKKLDAGVVLNRGDAPSRKIRYQMAGSTVVYVVPESFNDVELTVKSFENPKRNSLVLLYARQPD